MPTQYEGPDDLDDRLAALGPLCEYCGNPSHADDKVSSRTIRLASNGRQPEQVEVHERCRVHWERHR